MGHPSNSNAVEGYTSTSIVPAMAGDLESFPATLVLSPDGSNMRMMDDRQQEPTIQGRRNDQCR
jgi:hypothetical protein